MQKIYNFSAGPSTLPEYVLIKARENLLSYKNTGQSVMEMSHRSNEFLEILNSCETLLKDVLNVPKNYKVLFLQGGASTQFSMIPMNLMNKNNKADFILSGYWSEKAFKEASKFGKTSIVASSKKENYKMIPKIYEENLSQNADYLHFCYNNTIYGTRFHKIPIHKKNIPLVCDISSFIASEPLDISEFDLLYAGAQKNLGIAGLTIVILKDDLPFKINDFTPTMMSYKTHIEKNSMYNTPPCFAIYICMLVLEWIKYEMGGLLKIKEINHKKANLIYDYLDNSKIFNSFANKQDRSTTNIVFTSHNKTVDENFINFAFKSGLINLKGHRELGGMRASIYNGMPLSGVKKLLEVMHNYEKGVNF